MKGDGLLLLFSLNKLPWFLEIPLFKPECKCRRFLGLCCSYIGAKSDQVRATPSSGLQTITPWTRLSTRWSNTWRVASPLLASWHPALGSHQQCSHAGFQHCAPPQHLSSLHSGNHGSYFSEKIFLWFLQWLKVRLIPWHPPGASDRRSREGRSRIRGYVLILTA